MAALLNYIPYVGAIVGIAIMAVVAFLTFKETGARDARAGRLPGLNFVESYFVTPMVLGRRLTLNPVVIFIGLTFWGWIWGVTGALIAVPLMVILKISATTASGWRRSASSSARSGEPAGRC